MTTYVMNTAGGGDYTSLNAALSDLDGGSHSGLDHIITCEGGVDEANMPAQTSALWTDPPDSLTIKAAAGEEATTEWDTGKYIRRCQSSWNYSFYISTAQMNWVVEGLQFETDLTNQTCMVVYNAPASASEVQIIKNHFKGSSASGNETGINLYTTQTNRTTIFANNIFNGLRTYGIRINSYFSGGTVMVVNNTMVNCLNSGLTTSQLWGTVRIAYNNLIVGSTTNDWTTAVSVNSKPTEPSTVTDGNTFTEDASSIDTNHQSITVTDLFVSATDFAINAAYGDSSPVKDGGTDLSAHSTYAVTEDINGTTRAATPSVGAFEFVAVASGVSITVQSLTQLQSVDLLALGVDMPVNPLVQSQTLDALTLTQKNSVPVDEVNQEQAIDSPALGLIMPIDAVSHAQAIDEGALNQKHDVSVDEVTQGQTIDSPGLAFTMAIDAIDHSQALDEVPVSQKHSVPVDALTQNQTIGNVTFGLVISTDALTQLQAIDGSTLSQKNAVAIDELKNLMGIDGATLVQKHTLPIDALTSSQDIENAALLSKHAVAIQELIQLQSLGSPSMAITMPIEALTQAQPIEAVSLAQAHALGVDSLTQQQIIDAVVMGIATAAVLQGEIFLCSLVDGSIKLSPLLDGKAHTEGLLTSEIDITQ